VPLGSGKPAQGFRRITLVFVLIAVLLFPSGASCGAAKPADLGQSVDKEKAPDFVLRDLKGQRFKLGDHRENKPVLIIFSTTWCTFCKSEIPHFKSIYATYAKRGLEVVNIDIQESKDRVSKFTAEHQLPYRVLLDQEGTVSGVYDIRGVPSMVLVDKSGKIVCRQCRNVETLLETLLTK